MSFPLSRALLLAVVAAWIAYRQYSLGRAKFKLDLFEKRFVVFAATRKLLSEIARDARVSLGQLFEFRGGVAEASFLFGTDIADYLKVIDENTVQLHTLIEGPSPMPVGDQRSKTAGAVGSSLGRPRPRRRAFRAACTPLGGRITGSSGVRAVAIVEGPLGRVGSRRPSHPWCERPVTRTLSSSSTSQADSA